MKKVSAQRMQKLLASSARLLKQAAVALEEKDKLIEQFRQKEAAASIYDQMQEKNISPPWASSENEAVQQLLRMPPEKRAAVQMAVDMAAPQHPFAQLDLQKDTSGDGRNVRGDSAFEQYILGNFS